MSERRDAGKSLVTDYSRSSMDPERAARLNKAELEYVNGVWDAEDQEWIWPTYPGLAEKHNLPLHLVSEQANKHKWGSRRERRKTEMISFQNEQTRKRWLEEEREIMGVLMTNVGRSVMTIARLQDEHTRLIKKVLQEEAERRDEGDDDPVIRVGIRISEVEGLVKASETAMKTMEKMVLRIQGLPTALQLSPAPPLMLTVEQEEAEAKATEEEAAAPQSTLLQIYREMRKIEEARARIPKVIYGETDDDE